MLKNFLQHTCNIDSVSMVLSWWEESKSFVNIYSWIQCYYYKRSTSWFNEWMNIAQEVDNNVFSVMLEWNKKDVRIGHRIEIIDSVIWSIWFYIITTVKWNKLLNGTVDHIRLLVRKLEQ